MEDLILMPKTLTSERGHKGLLIGEFHETIEVSNPDYCGCGKCDYCIDVADDENNQPYISQNIAIRWTTIKDIYNKIVEFELSKNR